MGERCLTTAGEGQIGTLETGHDFKRVVFRLPMLEIDPRHTDSGGLMHWTRRATPAARPPEKAAILARLRRPH
jgi:hypothetical protein